MKCAEVQAQLVELLYGELSVGARAAIDEHVRGCPACKTELASHQLALAQARKALAGPLAQDPPSRVHAAVLAAARQAVQPQARSAAKDALGFLPRFWRTPWFLPAFGAVSVATVVFLVKVLKNPEVIPGQQAHSVEERALIPAAPPTPPPAVPAGEKPAREDGAAAKAGAQNEGAAAEPGARKAASRPSARGRAPAADEPARKAKTSGGGLAGLATGGKGTGRGYAEPPPSRPATKEARDLDRRLRGLDESTGAPAAQPAAAPAAAKKSARAAEPSRSAEAWERPTGTSDRSPEDSLSNRRAYASPPPAPSAAPAAVAPAPTAASAPPPSDAPRAPAGPAKASAPASAHSARRKQAEAPTEKAADEQAISDDLEDADLQKSERGAAHAASGLDESVRKADRLFAAQEWSAAAVAYRDLLRRFPSHKDASKWRERMNRSLVAEQEQRKASDAKAAKAKADDAAKPARE